MAAAVVHLEGAPLRVPEQDLTVLEDELRRLVPPVNDARRFRQEAGELADRLSEIRSSCQPRQRLFLARSERFLLLQATDARRGASTALDVLLMQLQRARAA
jgi:hypothetical protein